MRELSCAQCLELCPEVALCIAEAEDRADVLAHVERCRSCGDELSSLSDVADLLCELVPRVDPPFGFTSRAIDAISAPSQPEPFIPFSRRRHVRPLSVAAAVVVAAAIGLGGWLAAGGGSRPSVTVETAPLLAAHHTIGQVVTVPGGEPWISMTVHVSATTVVRCEVEGAKGGWWTIGTFHVYDGHGYWAAPLPHALAVRRAELVTPSGRVLATASLAES
jgi:hypothetical protein